MDESRTTYLRKKLEFSRMFRPMFGQSLFDNSSYKYREALDFYDIVSFQNIFVDKTNFLKEIMDSREKAILINRPSGWGKSINLSLLDYFLGWALMKIIK